MQAEQNLPAWDQVGKETKAIDQPPNFSYPNPIEHPRDAPETNKSEPWKIHKTTHSSQTPQRSSRATP